MATDFTKAPAAIIVDLINEDNPGHGLTTELLTLGVPAAAPGGSPVRNTQLRVTAAPGSGYVGFVDVLYDRVDMADIPGLMSKIFPVGNAVNVADLIPEVNARYGINITSSDFVDAPLPAATGGIPNEQVDFVVTAAADSLVWLGSLTLKYQVDEIELSTVITTTTLNGLVYVAPEAP